MLHAGPIGGVLRTCRPGSHRRDPALRVAGLTLERIGGRLGLTRERVRQIESAALQHLRRLLAARDVEPSDLL
jgi:hypothetical protein